MPVVVNVKRLRPMFTLVVHGVVGGTCLLLSVTNDSLHKDKVVFRRN